MNMLSRVTHEAGLFGLCVVVVGVLLAALWVHPAVALVVILGFVAFQWYDMVQFTRGKRD